MSFFEFLLCIALVAVILSLWLVYRLRGLYAGLDWLDRATLILSPIWLGSTLALLVDNVLTVPRVPWNSIRLLPTFALANGYDVYHPLNEGLLTGNLYPPISFLIYSPVLLTSTPTSALLLAGVINGLLLIVPAGLIFWTANRREARRPLLAALGCCLFVWLALHSRTMEMAAYNIHADLGALAFGALACLPFFVPRGEPSKRDTYLSSTFLVLAIWTKQPMIALALGIPGYLAVAFGFSTAVTYIKRLAIVGGAISLVVCAVFGAEDLFFNIIMYPALHPREKYITVSLVFLELVRSSWEYVFVIALAVAEIFWMRRKMGISGGWRTLFREHAWILPVTVAVSLLPLSFLQRFRVGGWWNSYHFVYFLVLAAALVLVSVARRTPKTKVQGIVRHVAYVAMVLALIVSMNQLRFMSQRYNRLERAVPQVVYNFLESKQAVAYFPWNPVATFMAEGKIYHLDVGVYTLYLAGRLPAKLPGPGFLPKDPEFVVFSYALPYGPPPYNGFEDAVDRNGVIQYEKYFKILGFFPNYHRMSRNEVAADPRLRSLPRNWLIFEKRPYPRRAKREPTQS